MKAVVATEDPATVLKAAVSYQKTARSDLFIVTDRAGLVLAIRCPCQGGVALTSNASRKILLDLYPCFFQKDARQRFSINLPYGLQEAPWQCIEFDPF